jgi:hypothetical protein
MKRLHLHLSVPAIEPAIGFYTALFGARPALVKDDYARWELEEPPANLAISARGRAAGLDHLGIQVGDASELAAIAARLQAAGADSFEQQDSTCCYAKSDKSWVSDPAGLRWESFFTHGEAATYGEDAIPDVPPATCCGTPQNAAEACC